MNTVKISDILKRDFTEIEWQVLKAARNFYVHVYDATDWSKIWNTIQDELPSLKPKIEHIICTLQHKL